MSTAVRRWRARCRLTGATAAAVAVLTACGGSVGDDVTAITDAGAEDAHRDARAPRDAADEPTIRDAFSEYVDPMCPDAPRPQPDLQCDPYAPPPGGCPMGEACFPYVRYPMGDCQPEQFGAACQAAGTGVQGTPCDTGRCAGGFVCVVSGAGTQCVALCKLDGSTPCPSGLVCQAVDIPDVGGCL